MGFLKKTIPLTLSILIGAVAGVLISSALYASTGFSIFSRVREKPLPAEEVSNADMITLAYSILERIKDNDFVALSRVAHPQHGILFSPQATVAVSTNKRFSIEDIAAFGSDATTYVWGVYGASGEPIEMTPAEYFARFVFYKDYTAAPFVGFNHIVRTGNALENITDVFPNIQFIEFHIPGSEQDPNEAFDWSTLRLGFEKYDGSLWLTVIVHSEWSA